MASLIPGYECDVFISYRQKDNKYDGWVTEFVGYLKKELEAAFKEEISVYFDINPHDGLLETDDVDASLRDKLRCLVFIPVLSRTYCDPRSFAWEHEFRAFVEMASNDRFGLKVKLPNGNVAGRVLPVRIHELDDEDVKQCESVLGGVLRGVDFIYKSPGVNRPLLPREENPQDNLNHASYRDQINKLANVIREIISSMKNPDRRVPEKTESKAKHEPLKPINRKAKVIMGSIVLMVLALLGYFFLPEILKTSDTKGKSIAVLPFENLGGNKEDDWFGEAMTDETITQLGKIKELIVRPRTSVVQYRGTTKSIPEIGKELNVRYVIEGSVQRIEDRIRVRVNLVNVLNDNNMGGETYERKWEDISSLQSIIATQIAEKLETALTPEEKEQIANTQKNPQAYSSYLKGRFFWNKRTPDGLRKSIEYFKESISEDPGYAIAYAGLADAYSILAWWGWTARNDGYSKAKEYTKRALEIDKNLADAHALLGTLLCWSDWKWEEARKELKMATELNPNNANAHQYYSEFLDIIRDNKSARSEIDKALSIDPFSTAINATSALYYFNEGRFDEAIKEYNRTLEINPDFIHAYLMQFEIFLKKGEDSKASEAIQKYMLGDSATVPAAGMLKEAFSKSGRDGILGLLITMFQNNAAADLYIAKWYAIMGRRKEALDLLGKVIELHSTDTPGANLFPDEIPRIYNSPSFDNLRSEPQFKVIISKLGLSGYQVQ